VRRHSDPGQREPRNPSSPASSARLACGHRPATTQRGEVGGSDERGRCSQRRPGSLVLVEGEPGSGKTRLAQEAASPPDDEQPSFELLHAIARFLDRAAADRPLPVVLDDLHTVRQQDTVVAPRARATTSPGSRRRPAESEAAHRSRPRRCSRSPRRRSSSRSVPGSTMRCPVLIACASAAPRRRAASLVAPRRAASTASKAMV
jgi:hypothetical protein